MQARVIVRTCVRDRKKGELLRILLLQDQKEQLHSEHQCLQGPGLPHQVDIWKKYFWSMFLGGFYWFCYCDGVLFCFILCCCFGLHVGKISILGHSLPCGLHAGHTCLPRDS